MVLGDITQNNKHQIMVATYSIAHFLVDFACAFLMFRSVAGTSEGYLCVLLYNFFAFAFQMPLGLIADRCNRNYLFAATGCVLVGVAYGLMFFPIGAVIILGIGNALFHIGGGIDVLNISDRKSAALGIFVSPGAFGIYFGTILGRGSAALSVVILIVLLVAAMMIVFARFLQGKDYVSNAMLSLKSEGTQKIFLAIGCLFLVVCLRSYVGMAMNFPWKNITPWGVVLICAVVLGKTMGGFAADYFGAMKTTVFSLGAAAVLFLFSQIPLVGILTVLLFNMSMPITLWAIAKIFPGAKGFSFGMLTFALFLGFLPTYLGVPSIENNFWIFSLAAIISGGFLYLGLRRVNND